MLLVWAVVILLSVYLAKRFLTRTNTNYKLPPGPTPKFLKGTIDLISPTRVHEDTQKQHSIFGPMLTMYMGPYRILSIADPNLVREIVIDKKQMYTNSRMARDTLGYVFPKSVLVLEGSEWQLHRKMLSSVLRVPIIRTAVPKMAAAAHTLCDKWKTSGQNKQDIYFDIRSLALEMFSSVAFNQKLDCIAGDQKSLKLARAIDQVWAGIGTWSSYPFKFMKTIPTPYNNNIHKNHRIMVAHIEELIEDYKTNPQGKEETLLSALLGESDESGYQFSRKEIQDELASFIFGGYETTSNTITTILHELAKNPQVQEKLFDEIKDTLSKSGGVIDYDAIEKMRYLYCVVKEGMRLWPTAPMIPRYSLEDNKIGGYDVPANTMILLNNFVMQRDEQYFKSPEEFLPERWINTDRSESENLAYLPFGVGSRICIGRKLALTQVSVVICAILQRFSLRTHPGFENLKMVITQTLAPEPPVFINASLRL